MMDQRDAERRSMMLQSSDYVMAADTSVDGGEDDGYEDNSADEFEIPGVHAITLDDDMLEISDDFMQVADYGDEE